MTVFNPQFDTPTLLQKLDTTTGLVVACYCAEWCETCRDYRTPFQALADRWPQHVFVWIDIEECEHLLDEEEVENFPTLLLQGSQGNLFFGPMVPYVEQLEKLIERSTSLVAGQAGGPGPLRNLLKHA
jgi:thiol-disulfide isomerase/thioredoxin